MFNVWRGLGWLEMCDSGWGRGDKGWQPHGTLWSDSESGDTVLFSELESANLRTQAAGAAAPQALLRTCKPHNYLICSSCRCFPLLSRCVYLRAGLDRAERRSLGRHNDTTSGDCGGAHMSEDLAEVRLRWKHIAAEVFSARLDTQGLDGTRKDTVPGINLGTGTRHWAARMYPPTNERGQLPRQSTMGLPNYNNR